VWSYEQITRAMTTSSTEAGQGQLDFVRQSWTAIQAKKAANQSDTPQLGIDNPPKIRYTRT